MEGFKTGCLMAFIFFLLYFVIFIPAAWIGMLLWNSVLIGLFTSIPTIGFWQMYGLLWLIRIMIPYSSHISSN